jgi:hypothetical protein
MSGVGTLIIGRPRSLSQDRHADPRPSPQPERWPTASTTTPSTAKSHLIDRARQLAGLKGYVTNLPEPTMTGQAVIAAYHDLWQVEPRSG